MEIGTEFANIEYLKNDSEFIEFIRSNKKTLGENPIVLSETFLKIIPQTKMIKELYTYELLNFSPKDDQKVNDLDSLMNIMISEMKKYQEILGGFNLEDPNWLDCGTSNRFEVNKNQRAFYNSISQYNCADREFIKFVSNFVKYIKKFIQDPVKLSVDYKIKNDSYNEMCWVILACEERCGCNH